MSTRLPHYAVPREILDLVEQGYFEEVTAPGDDIRNFGLFYPPGVSLILWADRERREQRKRTMFRFGVAKFGPDGSLLSETSGDDLEQILKQYEKEILSHRMKYKKRWFPEAPLPLRHARIDWS